MLDGSFPLWDAEGRQVTPQTLLGHDNCTRCHRALKTPESRRAGMGKVCLRKATGGDTKEGSTVRTKKPKTRLTALERKQRKQGAKQISIDDLLREDGGERYHKMSGLTLGTKQDIRIERVPGPYAGQTDVVTNVPWSVVYHSPDGFEFGFGLQNFSPVSFDMTVSTEKAEPGRVRLDFPNVSTTHFGKIARVFPAVPVVEVEGGTALPIAAGLTTAAETGDSDDSPLSLFLVEGGAEALGADGPPSPFVAFLEDIPADGTQQVSGRCLAVVFPFSAEYFTAFRTAVSETASPTEVRHSVLTIRNLLAAFGAIKGGVRFHGTILTGIIPHSSAICHKGNDYGSGPADLALNILNLFVPPNSDGRTPVKCFVDRKGEPTYASATAFELHQQFKIDFIGPMKESGDVIRGEKIRLWLKVKEDEREAAELAIAQAAAGEPVVPVPTYQNDYLDDGGDDSQGDIYAGTDTSEIEPNE